MRLWHYELIQYLPKSQLLAQWRELNSIFKKQDKHILINYIYEYPKEDLMSYSYMVVNEMLRRGYKIKNTTNWNTYFKENLGLLPDKPFKNHHHYRYLKQCFYNLQEKYDRGQKDFSEEQYNKLNKFVINYLWLGVKKCR